jgi:serine/threonine protein kinase
MSETFCPLCGGVHEPGRGPCRRFLREGDTLPDGLHVLAAVGPVSLGELYRAEDPVSHVEFDLVLLDPEVAERMRPQFARAASIEHPNVAAIRAVGRTAEGMSYVAFEVLRGALLSTALETRRMLPLIEAADLILQAAAGLQAVHEAGLIHGNLSPETILILRTRNDRPLVKLIRFGQVHYGPEQFAGGDTGIRYAAPERVAVHPMDARSDVFSLGAVLLHLLTGAPPNTGLATSEPVPDAAWSVISRALDPVPERRFPTAAAFAEALARATAVLRASAWTRRARGVAVVGASLAVVVAGVWLARNIQRSRAGAAPIEAATARVPEAPETARPRSVPFRAAPPPVQPESRGRPTSGPGRSPSTPSQMTPKFTEVAPRLVAVKATPPESLELNVRLRVPLRLELSQIAVAHPPNRAAVAPRATARENSDAGARAAVAGVLATYAHALEANDLRAVEWAYPELTERERAAWKKFFSVARDLVVTLDVERYAIAESEANLDVRGTYVYWNRSLHRAERAPVRFLATLKRNADRWRLTAIH